MKHRETTTDPYNSVGKLIMAELEACRQGYKYSCLHKITREDFIELGKRDYREPGTVDPCVPTQYDMRDEVAAETARRIFMNSTPKAGSLRWRNVNNTDEKG